MSHFGCKPCRQEIKVSSQSIIPFPSLPLSLELFMELETPNRTNNAPLAIDTNVARADGRHSQPGSANSQPGSANSQLGSANAFVESPEAVGTYPPPSQPISNNAEKTEVEEHTQAPPVFSALAPKLSLTRRATTSYQKQTFRMESGINPAETIAERLEAWRGVLKNLVRTATAVRAHIILWII
jgi:hypothetical protein